MKRAYNVVIIFDLFEQPEVFVIRPVSYSLTFRLRELIRNLGVLAAGRYGQATVAYPAMKCSLSTMVDFKAVYDGHVRIDVNRPRF